MPQRSPFAIQELLGLSGGNNNNTTTTKNTAAGTVATTTVAITTKQKDKKQSEIKQEINMNGSQGSRNATEHTSSSESPKSREDAESEEQAINGETNNLKISKNLYRKAHNSPPEQRGNEGDANRDEGGNDSPHKSPIMPTDLSTTPVNSNSPHSSISSTSTSSVNQDSQDTERRRQQHLQQQQQQQHHQQQMSMAASRMAYFNAHAAVAAAFMPHHPAQHHLGASPAAPLPHAGQQQLSHHPHPYSAALGSGHIQHHLAHNQATSQQQQHHPHLPTTLQHAGHHIPTSIHAAAAAAAAQHHHAMMQGQVVYKPVSHTMFVHTIQSTEQQIQLTSQHHYDQPALPTSSTSSSSSSSLQ
ncbi:pair-rule protein odd-paired-like [Musca vetustissima]|uniref:pair-rule protein odd-paired-like n=1 Tax=Musca vetustissima TaxID=27455 RepID=UPI002AB6C3EE|nr:pair-rule protein odd-paired-like [Musca vetustissima]